MVEIDNQPWFVVPDVCEALGLARNPANGSHTHHLVKLPESERKVIEKKTCMSNMRSYLFPGRTARASLVSESGLYKLIMRSDKPEARKFQDWVTREVLPAIRKDGAYIMDEEKVRTGEISTCKISDG